MILEEVAKDLLAIRPADTAIIVFCHFRSDADAADIRGKRRRGQVSPFHISSRVDLFFSQNGSQVGGETIVRMVTWYDGSTMVCMFSIGFLSTRLFIASHQVRLFSLSRWRHSVFRRKDIPSRFRFSSSPRKHLLSLPTWMSRVLLSKTPIEWRATIRSISITILSVPFRCDPDA